MRILERLKRYRELRRLRSDVARAPSPRTFAALAERHVAHGDVQDALLAAEDGLARYPDSERLQHVRAFTKRKLLAGRIRRLRSELERRPTPFAYTSLAEIYRELGDDDEALRLATACGELFPLNAQPFMVIAEVRLERFLQDLVAHDAIHAHDALQRVVRLNEASVKARLLLAELCHLVGAPSECRRHLEVVLRENGNQPEIRAFVESLDTGGDDDAELSSDMLAARARVVEEACDFAAEPDAFPMLLRQGRATRHHGAVEIDVDALSRDVAAAGRSTGMRNTVLLDGDGSVLAEHADDAGMSRDGFADVARRLRRASDRTSRRMDAGALVRTEITGPAGDLTIVRLQRLTLAAHYSEPLRAEGVWEILQDITSRHVRSSREVACA